jgi:cystathionine beta-lyase/cystathionine gamma-synthase
MAAIHAMLTATLQSGDAVAASRELYGGTSAFLKKYLPRFGIEVRWFDPFDDREIAAAIAGKVRHVHVETPTNPICRVVDLRKLAAAAHDRGALLSVDATFVPPPFQKTLEHGVDLVMHSGTKFFGGHSDVLAGVVAGRHQHLEPVETNRRISGGVLGPDGAWLLVRSMPTLELRVERMMGTAARLAGFLAEVRGGGKVQAIHYPGLPNHPDHALAKTQMRGFGSLLAFEVSGGLQGAMAAYDRFGVIARAVSLGGVETVASLPLHTSHAMATPEERRRAGIADGLVRLSVGLEPFETLQEDLAQALRL